MNASLTCPNSFWLFHHALQGEVFPSSDRDREGADVATDRHDHDHNYYSQEQSMQEGSSAAGGAAEAAYQGGTFLDFVFCAAPSGVPQDDESESDDQRSPVGT